ncbi:hypothetical protein D3C79_1112580 [compost metagenome]
MQRIVHYIILADIIPHILRSPVGNRIELDQPELIIIFYLLRIGPGRGLVPANPGNPSVVL